MDITQLLAGVSSSINSSSSMQVDTNDYSNFKDYMNSFIGANQSVKSNVVSDYKIESNSSYSEIKMDKFVNKFKRTENDFSDPEDYAEVATSFPLQPLSLEEKEAFERIAVMIADSGLDGESLENLSEEEISELVDWVLAGAGGLFPVYQEENPPPVDSEATVGDPFGLSESVQALQQLEDLFSRISENSESDTALVGKLIDLESLDSLDIDKLAQAILKLAEKTEGATADSIGGEKAINLRELLSQVPAEELRNTIDTVLQEVSPGAELPEMPESVLKSLSIEIVNVNNDMLDAADTRSMLLDGLSNNSQLREEILSDLSSGNTSEELLQTFTAESGEEIVSDKVLNDLAEAVLEDSTPEEIIELELDSDNIELIDNNLSQEESGTVIVGDDIEITQNESEGVQVNTQQVQSNLLVEDAKVLENTANLNTDNSLKSSGEGEVAVEEGIVVKATVKEEAAVSTEQTNSEEVNSKKEEESTGKDVLTGKSFKEKSNSDSSSQGDQRQSSSESDDSSSPTGKSLFEKDQPTGELSKATAFAEQFADVESKAEFKIFTPENNQNAYVNDNPNVRYSDLIENMEKIEKLLEATSDKTLKSVKLEFSPPELGKLTIDVSVKNGNVTASLKVETDGARNMLMSNVEQLKKNLESHGIKLENFEVELNKQDTQDKDPQNAFAQARQHNEEQARKGHRNGRMGRAGGEVSAGEDVEEVESNRNGIGDDGSVDIVA